MAETHSDLLFNLIAHVADPKAVADWTAIVERQRLRCWAEMRLENLMFRWGDYRGPSSHAKPEILQSFQRDTTAQA
jgi:hypothetical protein